ncbi:uroporphyrinogen-III synthase [Paracidovorax anthurii]|uniref:Uroporphyrinogen-III synthase n=1 Tax=Paracidovorax anthurii TaxID=78229 RepID=A0A328YY64_9BURK|nr:uroporphyrinogen-III synthase [Paracidovorax anthurii]RAR78659.1 uroporphyrinogen-III synthase [Paracidovorax anthurii]
MQWVVQLHARGIDAVALPLIAIRPCAHPEARAALRAARQAWAGWRAVMFVSSNAAHHFFEPEGLHVAEFAEESAIKTRVWSPGPGTARALRQAGVPAAAIDQPDPGAAQFDSESLWQQVAPQVQPGDRILIVRGAQAETGEAEASAGHGREWLAQQIAAAGGRAEFVAAYERAAPQLSPPQQALARAAAADGSLWIFSSSEAVAHLREALPGQDWHGARALATHPRIAQAAQDAGFGAVRQCRPALDDVVASIESHP